MIGESGVGFFEPCVTGCAPRPKVLISPVGDNYTAPVTVSITASGGTGSLTIRYTTDGSMPTTTSPVYTTSFVVSAATTVRAISIDAIGKISDLDGQVYTFVLPKPKVLITPAAGNYYNPISVTLTASSGTPPYTIYYTTNGNTPTTTSTVYSAPINVSTAKTVKALVVDSKSQQSAIASSAYTFVIPAPVVSASPAGGNFYLGNVNVTLTANSPRPPVTIHYTTNGTTPTVSSPVYSTNIALSGPAAKTIKYFGVDNNGRVGAIDTQRYTFNPIPDINVYFKKPAAWGSAIKIYYWNAMPVGSVPTVTWPGIAATKVCPNGNWWKFTFNGVTSVNVIFNDGAGNQTSNLANITADSYFDYNTKLNYVPNVNLPVASLSATPVSGTAPLTVNFDASASSGCTQLGYFWDFGNGNSQQTGINAATTQTYTAIGNYNMKLVVQDQNNNRDTITKSIQVTNNPVGQIIHLKPASSWTTVPPKIYYWNTTPATPSISWPGMSMVSEGNGWYKYTIVGASCSNIVFNNNTSPQTANLYHCDESWYDGTIPAWVNNPLPVKITSYNVRKKREQTIENYWTVSTEQNLAYYNIQRSTNGRDFMTIGKKAATGSGYYSFTDEALPALQNDKPQVIYYRLQMADKDNSKTYSNIVGVTMEMQPNTYTLFPNPASKLFYFKSNSTAKAEGVLSISDAAGRVVLAQKLVLNNGEPRLVAIPGLQSGIYLVQFTNDKGEIASREKLVVE